MLALALQRCRALHFRPQPSPGLGGDMAVQLNSRKIDKLSADLERLLDRSDFAETHYEVLGVSPVCTTAEVADAHNRVLALLEPVREALKATASTDSLDREVAALKRGLVLRLDRAFGRLALAHSTLCDPAARAEYDLTLCAKLSSTQPLTNPNGTTGTSELDNVPVAGVTPIVSEDDRRWNRRFNLYIAAQVTGYDQDGGRWEEPVETLDVSKIGLTFRIRKKVVIGRIVHISLPLPTKLRMHGFDEPNYNVYAIVRRAEPGQKGVRVVGVEFVGEQPPAGYLEKPWATFHDKSWGGVERRRKPRQDKDEVIWVEYFTDAMRSIRREAGRTENVSEGGMRVRIKSAPKDFEYVRVSYTDGRLQAFSIVCDRFVGEDNFERLCLRFLRNDELARTAVAAETEPVAAPIPLDPPRVTASQPAAEVHLDPRGSAPIQQPKVEVLRQANFRRRKILVADDDAPLRKTLGKILNTAGYEVTLVEDGKTAVARAAAEHPDLVITDALMPKMHGFLVCKTVKGFTPPPKVIMLTAVYTKPGYKWQARDQYGADDLLTKPFKVPELLEAIERQFAAESAPEPLSA